MPIDKHGHPIAVGDIVDVVYGGDHHSGSVEKIEPRGSIEIVHVRITAQIPSGSVVVNHEKPVSATSPIHHTATTKPKTR